MSFRKFRGPSGQARKLEVLAKQLLGRDIQQGHHEARCATAVFNFILCRRCSPLFLSWAGTSVRGRRLAERPLSWSLKPCRIAETLLLACLYHISLWRTARVLNCRDLPQTRCRWTVERLLARLVHNLDGYVGFYSFYLAGIWNKNVYAHC